MCFFFQMCCVAHVNESRGIFEEACHVSESWYTLLILLA